MITQANLDYDNLYGLVLSTREYYLLCLPLKCIFPAETTKNMSKTKEAEPIVLILQAVANIDLRPHYP